MDTTVFKWMCGKTGLLPFIILTQSSSCIVSYLHIHHVATGYKVRIDLWYPFDTMNFNESLAYN